MSGDGKHVWRFGRNGESSFSPVARNTGCPIAVAGFRSHAAGSGRYGNAICVAAEPEHVTVADGVADADATGSASTPSVYCHRPRPVVAFFAAKSR